jgi:ABC-2 type transport system ATP-binding protein
MHRGRIEVAGTLAEILDNLPARITAKVPPAVPLPFFHGTPTVDGQSLTVTTDRLQDDLFTLLHWADQHNVRLDTLAANPASLQEIFLAIGKEKV